MPIIVACPSCAGQLRVTDALIGKKVRCPACNATFDAVDTETTSSPLSEPSSKPAPPLELDLGTERVDPWKSLNLELPPTDQDSSNPPAPTKPQKDDLPPTEDSRPVRPSQRPRLNDDHDDLRPCPNCGRMVHRDSRRCISCGERLSTRGAEYDEDYDYDEDDVRYQRRRRKRDWEPHRAGFVLTMGILSAATPFTCWPLSFAAIIPGIMAWVMGSSDLKKMREGVMDPEGKSNTQAGWVCGIVGTFINLLVLLGCMGFFGFIYVVESQQQIQRQRQQRFAPPPPMQRPR